MLKHVKIFLLITLKLEMLEISNFASIEYLREAFFHFLNFFKESFIF